jgi:hypothetical protein
MKIDMPAEKFEFYIGCNTEGQLNPPAGRGWVLEHVEYVTPHSHPTRSVLVMTFWSKVRCK